MAFNPAHAGLERVESVELDGYWIAHARSFNKLDFAPVRREVEHLDSIVLPAEGSQVRLRTD